MRAQRQWRNRPPSWRRRQGAAWLVLLLALASAPTLAQAPAASPAARVVLLDGAVVSGAITHISEGRLRGAGLPATLTLDDLWRIEMPSRGLEETGRTAVAVKLRGGTVEATQVTFADDRCRIAWKGGEPLSVPLDAVRAIQLDRTPQADFNRALAAPAVDLDRIFVLDEEGKPASFAGVVSRLDDWELEVEVEGTMRVLARKQVRAVVIAQPDATDRPPRVRLSCSDRSVLAGESLALADGWATLALADGGAARCRWSAVEEVAVRSPRLTFLSDWKPVRVDERAIVTWPYPWQRNKSVSGGPLVLGSRRYDQGIGVHARSALTFALAGPWDVLAATIGLDAAAEGQGDCEFVVLADGRPVARQRKRGGEPPSELRATVAGAREVTLLVEPGAGLDLADHADWCDVRLIRTSRTP